MTPVSDTRWFGAGSSNNPNGHLAGEEAAAGALRSDAKLLIVFYSGSHDPTAVVKGVRAVSNGVPLIGCSTAGEISTNGSARDSVVVAALGGPGFSVATGVAGTAGGRHREAGAEVAACVDRLPPSPHQVLLLLPDGLSGKQQEIIRGAYGVLGAVVPLVGGGAGDGLRMQQTTQLYDDDVLHDSVVAAAVGSDSPMGIGVHHGWCQVGSPMMITRCAGGRIYELGDAPALDEYLRRLQAPAEVYSDPAAFTAFAMTHPLGLVRRSGGEEMRFISEADFAERALVCMADVPQGGLVWPTEGDAGTILAATDAACEAAVAGIGGARPIGLLAFDCIARRIILGEDGVRGEIGRILSHAGRAPVAGFYTCGEIARVRGINGYHNQTLVVLALS